jgi:hypothetical protein
MLVATLLLYLLGLQALRADRASLDTIGHDTAPNIVAAQELSAQLASLDAELANALLGSPAERDVANELFEMRRSAATRRLDDAAAMGGGAAGQSERIPILIINEETGRYLELAGRAQWLYAQGDRDGSLLLLRLATDLMHQRILPAADALDAANRHEMDEEFAQARAASSRFQMGAVAAGAFLFAFFLAAQVFIRARMRRRFVPALLAGSLLTFSFMAYLVAHLADASEDLRVAHDDAFVSIHSLWRARAVLADAEGDESRWLLDRPRASYFEGEFQAKRARLDGYLSDELHNVTFQGELAAAQDSVAAQRNVLGADGRVRDQESHGAHGAAVTASIGATETSAATSFDRLDEGLQRTLDINQWWFDSTMGVGEARLARAELVEPAFALAIVLCAWLGVRARLREYA